MKNGDHCIYDSAIHRTWGSTDSQDGQDAQTENPLPILRLDGHDLKRRRKAESIEGNQRQRETFSLNSGDDGSIQQSSLADSSASEPSQDIGSKLDRLTAMVEHLSRKGPPEVAASPKKTSRRKRIGTLRPISGHDGSNISRRLFNEFPPTRTDISSKFVINQELDHSEGDTSSDQREPDDKATDAVGDLSLGHLSLQEGGRSRYIGSTYWAYLTDEITELNRLLRDKTRYYPPDLCNSTPIPIEAENNTAAGSQLGTTGDDLFSMQTGDLLDKSILFRTAQSPKPSRFATLYGNFLDGLPSKRQCHILYRCYISGVHIVFPIGHPPTMLRWYDHFFNWYDHRETNRAPYTHIGFIPLLFAILYGGSVSCSVKIIESEFPGTSRLSLSTHFHDKVTASLSLLSFATSPSLPSLMAFCIVQTILCREEEPLTSSLFVSLALRIAQNMGLHQEPSKFGINSIDAETRRRIWWHIVWMDTMVSNSTGWPPSVISNSYWDVNDISELKDSLIGTQDGEKYLESVQNGSRQRDNPDNPLHVERHSHVSVAYVVAQGKYTATS